jgi:hypothetical protein
MDDGSATPASSGMIVFLQSSSGRYVFPTTKLALRHQSWSPLLSRRQPVFTVPQASRRQQIKRRGSKALLLAAIFIPLLVQACGPDQTREHDGSTEQSDPDGGTPDTELPKFVTIEIVGATVAPFKADQTPWDGIGTINEEVIEGLGKALASTNPYTSVIAYLAGPIVNGALDAFDKPDPYGNAKVFVSGSWSAPITLASRDGAIDDTFTPQWSDPPSWNHIPLDSNLRVQVSLTDADLSNDDGIGVAEIPHDEIVAALTGQTIRQVNVATQTQNQLLFVGISVVPAD